MHRKPSTQGLAQGEPSVTACTITSPKGLRTHHLRPSHSGCPVLTSCQTSPSCSLPSGHRCIWLTGTEAAWCHSLWPYQIDVSRNFWNKEPQREVALHIHSEKSGRWGVYSRKYRRPWQELVSLLQKMEGGPRQDSWFQERCREGDFLRDYHPTQQQDAFQRGATADPEPGKGFLGPAWH